MGSPREAAPASAEPPIDGTATGTGASEEPPLLLPPHFPPEWSASLQAFYASGAAAVVAVPPAFYSSSPIWAPQPPYGSAIPWPALYLPVAMPYPAACGIEGWPPPPPEEEGKNKSPASKAEGSPGKSGNGSKGTSASGEIASRSGDNAMEGSSDTRDGDGQRKDLSSSRIRSYGNMIAEGEVSHPVTTGKHSGVSAESSYSGGARYAKKLPVSAPGRALLPGPDTDFNTSLELWTASHAGPTPLRVRSNEVNSGPLTLGNDLVMHEQKQMLDERELRRERRKLSNRESARRSRLRKQQECEDLARSVAELNNEKSLLKVEIESFKKICEELEAENRKIMEQLSQTYGPCYPDVLGIRLQ